MKEKPWWVLVGGRQRLGRHLAERLASDCNLMLSSGRSWDADASWIADLARQTHVKTVTWNAEDPNVVPTMMAEMARFQEEGLQVQGCVVLVSAFPEQPLGTWTPEALAALWRLNLTFPLLVAQMLASHFAEGASLQFVLDTCIHRPFLKRLPYSVSRSGLAALVPGLARLWAPKVRVVGHALGTLLPAEGSQEAALATRTLLQRLGEPDDLVRAVRYAAEATHLTGEILTLDGGARWS